jgi:pyruvate formate lyase activating enzyme
MKKEAFLYEQLEDQYVQCNLCSHRCKISDGNFGFCGVRQNTAGVLYTHAYGNIIASHVDPIEKKPLYHFLPGSSSFSIAAIGCNFRCGFCQNWDISQSNARDGSAVGPGDPIAPETVVAAAQDNGCKSIAYTYTEPTIFLEYALDIARLAKAKGLRNIFVTNGYMTAEAIELVSGYCDAANIDLKFFTESAYKRMCGGHLEPVLNAIRLMRSKGIWVEITTLVIPGENDDATQLSGIAQFIADVDINIPWHLSRFHPDYKLTAYPATPESTLKHAQETGKSHSLKYIYIGNVQGWGNDTYCPKCQKLLIKREIFDILEYNMQGNACPHCHETIAGVFASNK